MKMLKTSSVISLLLLSLWSTLWLCAQNKNSPVSSKHSSPTAIALISLQTQPTFFRGWSLGFDVGNAVLASFSGADHYEVMVRANLNERYFPSFELGWERTRLHNEDTHLSYITQAPYFRLGFDYNLNKKSRSLNRMFVGWRYGFSPFSYDLFGLDVHNSTWNTTLPFRYTALPARMHWGEALFGLEAQIWKFVHLGWSIRYKLRIYEKQAAVGAAWHIPGFGRNREASHWGGNFYLLFDLQSFPKKIQISPPPQPQKTALSQQEDNKNT